MEVDTGVPGDFGMVCKMKKQRRKRQKLLIIDLFLDFAKNTTLHGLRYITEVGLSVVEKIFWAITFLISLGLCLWLIEKVWYKWQYSPVIVSFNERMISVNEIPFPSVTICPQWKCMLSKYKYEEQYKKFIPRYGKTIINNENEEEKQMLEYALLICDVKNKYLLDRNVSDEFLVSHIRGISPEVYDVFVKCKWRGKLQYCHHLFKEVLTHEGLCFNFNSLSFEDMFKNESIQQEYQYLSATYQTKNWNFNTGYTKLNGSVYPLRGQMNGANPDLEFTLLEEPGDSDEQCNSLSNGFKIYVQHPADMPQSSLYYYAAIPGQVTSLALKFSILNTSSSLQNYDHDQRQCYFTWDRPLDYFKIYTPSNCWLECLSKFTYKRCSCVWFHMPHKNSSELCTAQKRACVTKAHDELASGSADEEMGETCNCLPSCTSVQYDAEILKTTFDFKKDFIANKRSYNKSKGTQDFRFLDKYNFSKVEMYFKEPRFVSMRRSELFGLTDFLANCGGLLGLFLGFSFLSLIEIFYFCTLRLWCTLKKDIKIEKKKYRESMYKR
ncbi:pickpocket protein 28-like [Choristoneura fumiferana]|uniref:pickpocket protein 28-like n=1 Tax=Choristoneura fumiferana TaxID=7141 RepID=UPI003D15BA91